jgi:hypothetical protein
MVFTEGMPLDHSLPYSLWPTTKPFFDVFGKSTPLGISLPYWERAPHWTIRCHFHKIMPLDLSLPCPQRPRNWSVYCRSPKGPTTGSLAQPVQFSFKISWIPTSTLSTHHKKNYLKKKDIYCAWWWRSFIKYLHLFSKPTNAHRKKYDLSYTDIHVYVSVAFATIIGVLYKNADKIVHHHP